MKHLALSILFLLLLLLISISACKHDPSEVVIPGGGGGNGGGNESCDTLNISYPNAVVPIFDQYCLSCHSGSSPEGGIDLTNYSVVAQLAQNGTLLGAIRQEQGYAAMPPNDTKLTDCEIATIEIWIRDTTFTNPPLPCDTVNVSYPGTIYPLLSQYCLSCHSGSTPEGGLNFENYEDVAFVAQSGQLLGAIKHESTYSAMPPNGIMLSDCDISKFEIWIRDTTFTEPEPGGIPCDPDTVYFQNTILPLLQSSCGTIGCHDPGTATERIILTDYQNIMNSDIITPGNPRNSDLYEVITETDPDKIMPPPPNAALTAEQKNAVFIWIQQGALDNYCDQLCDTVNVTYAETVWPIVQGRCFGCHNGPSPQGGISLDNYENIVAVANTGKLMGSIKHEPGFSPMPQNGAKLSDCNITQIQKWINDGTPNN